MTSQVQPGIFAPDPNIPNFGKMTRAEELRRHEDEHKGIVLYINDYCPKGCSFCFIPGQIKMMDREMPLENIRRLIDDLGFKHFQVQGGEPTLHSQFIEILELFKSRGVTCNVLSNTLYNGKIRRAVHQAILDEVITGKNKCSYNNQKNNFFSKSIIL